MACGYDHNGAFLETQLGDFLITFTDRVVKVGRRIFGIVFDFTVQFLINIYSNIAGNRGIEQIGNQVTKAVLRSGGRQDFLSRFQYITREFSASELPKDVSVAFDFVTRTNTLLGIESMITKSSLVFKPCNALELNRMIIPAEFVV